MRGYDMDHVKMKSKGSRFLTLEVPGLAEKRPSLVYGDSIFARLATVNEYDPSPTYQVCPISGIYFLKLDQVQNIFDAKINMYTYTSQLLCLPIILKIW